jgi:hypothetical protein
LDVIEVKIPAFLIAEFGHPLEEICIKWGLSRQHTDKADAQYLRLELRTRRERPGRRRAAEQSDERATGHSITSSARTINAIGTWSPIALAALRLMISSNFVGCSTGRLEGLAPRRILST